MADSNTHVNKYSLKRTSTEKKQKHTTKDQNSTLNILWDVGQYSWAGIIWAYLLLVNKFTRCSIQGFCKQPPPNREYWWIQWPPLLSDQYMQYTKSALDVKNSIVMTSHD